MGLLAPRVDLPQQLKERNLQCAVGEMGEGWDWSCSFPRAVSIPRWSIAGVGAAWCMASSGVKAQLLIWAEISQFVPLSLWDTGITAILFWLCIASLTYFSASEGNILLPLALEFCTGLELSCVQGAAMWGGPRGAEQHSCPSSLAHGHSAPGYIPPVLCELKLLVVCCDVMVMLKVYIQCISIQQVGKIATVFHQEAPVTSLGQMLHPSGGPGAVFPVQV